MVLHLFVIQNIYNIILTEISSINTGELIYHILFCDPRI